MNTFETQDILSRLMANENISVEHQPVETASFDTFRRVLTLPIYNGKMSTDLSTLFISHEISHALNTPTDWYKSGKIISPTNEDLGKMVLNLVEDIRIEKRIKTKYPGCKKYFPIGYKELISMDFFGLKGQDPNDLGLLDRINIYYKCGPMLSGIQFTTKEEIDIIEELDKIDSWEKVIESSKNLLKYANELDEKKQHKPNEKSNTECTTQENLDKNIKKFQTCTGKPNVYCDIKQISEKEFGNYVKNWKDIYKEITKALDDKSTNETYRNISKNLKKEVDFIVNQFERYKAAAIAEKTRIAKTGIINPNKLFRYKFSEDIFFSTEIVPKGKNHGLIIVIDFSSSMYKCISDVCYQVLSLVLFAKRQNIPFDVYGFTFDTNTGYYKNTSHKINDDTLQIGNSNVLYHFLSSEMNFQQFHKGAANFIQVGLQNKQLTRIGYGLQSTPLNHALLCLNSIIPKFKKNYDIDILNLLTITDGGATDVVLNTTQKNLILKNTKTKKIYNGTNTTQMILNYIKDTHSLKSLGFYIGDHQYLTSVIKHSYDIKISPKELDEIKKQISKNHFASITSKGYDKFYFISQEVFKSSNISITDIKSPETYVKILLQNQSNFKKKTLFLSKFIETIATNL